MLQQTATLKNLMQGLPMHAVKNKAQQVKKIWPSSPDGLTYEPQTSFSDTQTSTSYTGLTYKSKVNCRIGSMSKVKIYCNSLLFSFQ